MITKNAVELVNEAYVKYGSYVNDGRGMPSIEDGLKDVQRRVLISAEESGCRSAKQSSAKIVGECMSRYHPHGDSSIYGSLVSMVISSKPLFLGKGNFGLTAVENEGAAAMRYTAAGLSPLSELLLRDRDFVTHTVNDLDVKEPVYLPTPIPYALLAGSKGIGVGASTLIPSLTLKSIKRYCKSILIGNARLHLQPEAPGGRGNLTITPEQLELLHSTGRAEAIISATVKWEYSEDEKRDIIVVEDAPEYISYGRVKAILRTYLSDGHVTIRDESTNKGRLTILRTSRVRSISDSEMFELVRKSMTRTITFNCVVSDNKVTRRVGLDEWMSRTINNAISAYTLRLNSKVKSLETELLFIKYKKIISTHLLENTEFTSLADKYPEITPDLYSFTKSKSISQLSSKVNKDDFYKQELNRYKSLLNNIKSSFYSEYIEKL